MIFSKLREIFSDFFRWFCVKKVVTILELGKQNILLKVNMKTLIAELIPHKR